MFDFLSLFSSHCKSFSSGSGIIDDSEINGYNETIYLRTDNFQILNRIGEAVVIRDFGLRGCLMPEGYMFNTPDYFGSTRIRDEIAELIGVFESECRFKEFRTNYVKEADIIAMKKWGADYIRIPFIHKIYYELNIWEI